MKTSIKKKTSDKPVQCIVKSSQVIRNALQHRFKELNLSLRGVAKDAKERGMSITVSSLSRYFSHGGYIKSGLSQFNIVWLCIRYSVSVQLKVQVLEYNEKTALENIKKLFG